MDRWHRKNLHSIQTRAEALSTEAAYIRSLVASAARVEQRLRDELPEALQDGPDAYTADRAIDEMTEALDLLAGIETGAAEVASRLAAAGN